MNDNIVGGSAPGDKGIVVSRYHADIRETAKALSGSSPNDAQVRIIQSFSTRLDYVDQLPSQPYGLRKFSPNADDNGEIYRDGGHLVTDAVLTPRRVGFVFGGTGFYKPVEPVDDALVRKATILLGGVAAEDFATGSLHFDPFKIALFAYLAVCLAEMKQSDPENEILKIFEIVASVLGLNWWAVESVVEALVACRSTSVPLMCVKGTMTIDGDTRSSKKKSRLRHYFHDTSDDLIDLARELQRLGGCA